MPQTLTFVVEDNTAQSHFHNNTKGPITATHQITGGAFFVCDTAGGSFTITLPDATVWKDRHITLKQISATNTLTIDTLGETIDGAASKTLSAQYAILTVHSDGINWHIK